MSHPITEDTKNKLFQLAIGELAKDKAYCPYSKFHAGAAVLTEDGYYFQGCNVENASSATICAERTAVVNAVSEGHKKIIALAYSTDQTEFLYSCGICRQFLSEFGYGALPIYLLNASGNYKEATLGSLLPYTFNLDNLQSC